MRGSRIAVLVGVLLMGLPVLANPAEDEGIPDEDREGIELALDAEIEALLEAKNEEGEIFQRGAYSRSFQPAGDGTYQVGFHKDTAETERLITERYVYTLALDEAGEWTVTGRELQDRYDELRRGVPGDETWHRFESFSFEREGLRVEAKDGVLYQDYRAGRVSSIRLEGTVDYSYRPPMAEHQAFYEAVLEGDEDSLLFEADRIGISGDPDSLEEILAEAFSGVTEAGYADAPRLLQRRYDRWQKGLREWREDWAFSGYSRGYEPGRRHLRVSVGNEDERGITLDIDSHDSPEVSFSARGLFDSAAAREYLSPLFHYWSEPTRQALAEGRVTRRELEYRDDLFSRDYDLLQLSGEVELALRHGEHMTGDIAVVLRTKRPERIFPFWLGSFRGSSREEKSIKDPKLTINSVRDRKGRELTVVKTSSVGGLVVLPEELPEGSVLVLRMQYENEAGIYQHSPSYSGMPRSGWLPFVRFGDMHDLDLVVKVPSRYQVLGIGLKVEDRVEGDVRFTRWMPTNPVDFPTVIFGDYVSAKSSFPAKRVDGSEIAVEVHVDRISMGQWGIAPKSLPTIANQAANSLNLYQELLGVEYPYDKLDLVNDPFGFLYGQAPSSIVYLGSGAFFSEGAIGSLGGTDTVRFTKSLVAHEVAHQWWGSRIVNANDRHYWFIESLAEYCSSIYMQETYGHRAYLDHVNEWLRTIDDADLHRSVQGAIGFGGYQAAVYNKGPYAFHVMRATFGDEKFFFFLKELAQRLTGQSITTEDIQIVAEQSFGVEMDWFFDQWFRGVGEAELEVTYATRQTEDGQYRIQGIVEQRAVLGRESTLLRGQHFMGVLPITVEMKKDQQYTHRVFMREVTTPFSFKVPEKPQRVLPNHHGEILARDLEVVSVSWDEIQRLVKEVPASAGPTPMRQGLARFPQLLQTPILTALDVEVQPGGQPRDDSGDTCPEGIREQVPPALAYICRETPAVFAEYRRSVEEVFHFDTPAASYTTDWKRAGDWWTATVTLVKHEGEAVAGPSVAFTYVELDEETHYIVASLPAGQGAGR